MSETDPWLDYQSPVPAPPPSVAAPLRFCMYGSMGVLLVSLSSQIPVMGLAVLLQPMILGALIIGVVRFARLPREARPSHRRMLIVATICVLAAIVLPALRKDGWS